MKGAVSSFARLQLVVEGFWSAMVSNQSHHDPRIAFLDLFWERCDSVQSFPASYTLLRSQWVLNILRKSLNNASRRLEKTCFTTLGHYFWYLPATIAKLYAHFFDTVIVIVHVPNHCWLWFLSESLVEALRLENVHIAFSVSPIKGIFLKLLCGWFQTRAGAPKRFLETNQYVEHSLETYRLTQSSSRYVVLMCGILGWWQRDALFRLKDRSKLLS